MSEQANSSNYLCHRDHIPPTSAKGFERNGHAIIVVNDDGDFYAYRNSCPHLGVKLDWTPDKFLDAQSELLMCATHGALFLLDTGECVSGPCQGKALQTLGISLKNNCLYLSEHQ